MSKISRVHQTQRLKNHSVEVREIESIKNPRVEIYLIDHAQDGDALLITIDKDGSVCLSEQMSLDMVREFKKQLDAFLGDEE